MNSNNNQIAYWVCQSVGWGIYFIFLTITFMFSPQIDIIVIKLQIIITLTLATLSHGLRFFFKKNGWTSKPVKWVLSRLILVLIAASLISQVIIHALMVLIIKWQEYRPINFQEFFIYAANVFIIFSIWSLLYFIYHYWQNNRKKEVENWQLKAQLKEAELNILKSQINPHFLFNALNNIRSLILSEPETARDMITHISELMRYFIQFNAKEKVSIEQETEVVKDYLALEKIQFNDRLTYSLSIDEKLKHIKIPPMTIQLLTENAIKHGISTLPEGGEIKVIVRRESEELVIEVINSGQITNKVSESGIGLKNLKDRVELLFGQSTDIELENLTLSTVKASVKIPL